MTHKLIQRDETFIEPETLPEDEKRVYDLVDNILSQLYAFDWFEKFVELYQVEPVITEIIDQGKDKFSYKYYVFVSDYYRTNAGYLEIEMNLEYTGKEMIIVNADTSSHGYPASYGQHDRDWETNT